MSILDAVDDKRHCHVPKGKEFIIDNPKLPVEDRTLCSLDELSEAISLIDLETFQRHVNGEKNDFANWVEHVFGEKALADRLREFPTPLRMMVSIEKFLRQAQTPAGTASTAADAAKSATRQIKVETDK